MTHAIVRTMYVASAIQLSGLASTPCQVRPARPEEAAQKLCPPGAEGAARVPRHQLHAPARGRTPRHLGKPRTRVDVNANLPPHHSMPPAPLRGRADPETLPRHPRPPPREQCLHSDVPPGLARLPACSFALPGFPCRCEVPGATSWREMCRTRQLLRLGGPSRLWALLDPDLFRVTMLVLVRAIYCVLHKRLGPFGMLVGVGLALLG